MSAKRSFQMMAVYFSFATPALTIGALLMLFGTPSLLSADVASVGWHFAPFRMFVGGSVMILIGSMCALMTGKYLVTFLQIMSTKYGNMSLEEGLKLEVAAS